MGCDGGFDTLLSLSSAPLLCLFVFRQLRVARELGTRANFDAIVDNLKVWVTQADSTTSVGWAAQVLARLVTVPTIAAFVCDNVDVAAVLIGLIVQDKEYPRILAQLVLCSGLEAHGPKPTSPTALAAFTGLKDRVLRADGLAAVWRCAVAPGSDDEQRRCLRILRHLVRGDNARARCLLAMDSVTVLVALLTRHVVAPDTAVAVAVAGVDSDMGPAGAGSSSGSCGSGSAADAGIFPALLAPLEDVGGDDDDVHGGVALPVAAKHLATKSLSVELEATALLLELGLAIPDASVWRGLATRPTLLTSLRLLACSYNTDSQVTRMAAALLLRVDPTEEARHALHRQCCYTTVNLLPRVDMAEDVVEDSGAGAGAACGTAVSQEEGSCSSSDCAVARRPGQCVICMSNEPVAPLMVEDVDVGHGISSAQLHGHGVFLPCIHMFHSSCLFRWFSSRYSHSSGTLVGSTLTCPVCRRSAVTDVAALLASHGQERARRHTRRLSGSSVAASTSTSTSSSGSAAVVARPGSPGDVAPSGSDHCQLTAVGRDIPADLIVG